MNDAAVRDRVGEREWLAGVLCRDIPLGGAMELAITRLDARGIALAAPLGPNINDKGTAFGGALASMMILAGWSLPRVALRRHGLEADLVIGRCAMRFVQPVDGPLLAECDWPDKGELDAFTQRAASGRLARLDVSPRIVAAGEVAATLDARYAAVPRSR